MNNQAYDDTATRNPRKAYTDYENSTYTVVSKVAYLIGVQKRIFENEYEPPKMEWYEKLHADKNARIVRNLCMIRTALELNFKAINNRMRFDMCNLHSLPEYVPQDSLNELLQDGITIVRSRALPAEYVLPDIHWHKPTNAPNKFMGSGMYPPCAYVTYEHEYILVFRKGGNRKFTNAEKSIRHNSAYFWEERNIWFSDLWEIKGTTQKLKKGTSRARSAAFPFELAYRLVNMYSMKYDLVYDPFSGTGTVTKAAIASERNIVDINKHISNRINNCKSLFPLWLKWEYVRKLFLMPDGLNKKGIKAAAADYYANKNKYPYQVYINWSYMDSGNILYNDKKFVSLLYEANEDYFTDLSKVSDAGNLTKAGIYKFLDKSERVVVVVDCENSDPYKLYATLNNLNQEALLNKICKIILYDDIHTTSAWKILERFTQIPIEHVLIERIKENKSLVDIRLTTGTCREYYQNNVDSFILLSSDSDYWGLISAMPEVRFFVMVESEKCSPTIKNALINAGISYCYIDDFCTGNSNDIKVAAVLREVRQKLDQAFHLNVRDILDEACRATRADMTTAEKNQFYDKYIKTMHVDISPNGEATIVLGK